MYIYIKNIKVLLDQHLVLTIKYEIPELLIIL